MATVGSSTNIAWHKCSVEKCDREELLNQKGSVIWITGLSGSGIYYLLCPNELESSHYFIKFIGNGSVQKTISSEMKQRLKF